MFKFHTADGMQQVPEAALQPSFSIPFGFFLTCEVASIDSKDMSRCHGGG